MVTAKDQKRGVRERQQRYRKRHAERLKHVRRIEAILMRGTRRPDDMERLAELIAEFLDEADRRKLRRML
jgi:uncharacterized protein YciI